MLESLLQRVKDAIFDDDRTPYQRGDSGGLISQIENIFGQTRAEHGTFDNPIPASQDPLGDPADFEPRRGSSSEDLRQQFPGLRPASEDPLGDPADQERRW